MVGFFNGFRQGLKGFSLYRLNGLKRYLWLPIIIQLLLFTSLFYFGYSAAESWMLNYFATDESSWFSWLWTALHFILKTFTVFFLLFALGFISAALSAILASPFNSVLAEKLYIQIQNCSLPQTSFKENAKHAIARETLKILYFIKILVIMLAVLFLCWFVPILGIFTPVILFVYSAYILSIEFIDYPFEVQGLSFKEHRVIIKKQRLSYLGFGTAISLISSVPILNLVVVPVAITGATFLHDSIKQP